MLRSTRQMIRFPSKTVLEDVLTRTTGYLDPEAYSPFRGMPELIEEQFKGSDRTKFILEDCIEYNYKGDLNPSKVKVADTSEGFDNGEKVLAGYVYLEDMFENEEDARLWFTRQLIGYKIHSDSPFRKEDSYDTLMIGAGDDKDNEKELLEDVDNFDLAQHDKILNEIPYLLKIIHNKSKEMRAHLLSFLRAYAILLERGKKVSTINPKDFDSFALFRVKSDGTIDRQFDHAQDNRGEHYPAARSFILGYHPNDEAYKACMKLLDYYEYLGINWLEENPTIYNNSFMERLICTYLPSNEEYFQKYGQLDAEVVAALQPENIFKVGNRTSFFADSEVRTVSRQEILNYIKGSMNIDKLRYPVKWRKYKEDGDAITLEFLEKYFCRNMKRVVSLNDRFLRIDGFFYTLKRSIVVLQIPELGRFDGEVPNIIFSIYGMAIILPDRFEENVYYLPIEECIHRFEASRKGEPYETGWYIL